MKELDRYLVIFGVLIAIYLVFQNRQGFDSAIRGIGAFNIASIGTFQGNCTNAFGVTIGNCGGSLPRGQGSDPIIIFGDVTP